MIRMRFKVGDRVAAYGSGKRHTGQIMDVDGDGVITILPAKDGSFDGAFRALPQQCRLLRKRQPRRSIFVTTQDLEYIKNNGGQLSVPVTFEKKVLSDVEFREVRRK